MEDSSFLNINELLKSSDDAMWEFELARFVREYETISTTRMQTVPIAVYITTILNKLKEISDMDRIRLVESALNSVRILLRCKTEIDDALMSDLISTILGLLRNSSDCSVRTVAVRCLINATFESEKNAFLFWSENFNSAATISSIIEGPCSEESSEFAKLNLHFYATRLVYMMVSQSPELLGGQLAPTQAATQQLVPALAQCLQECTRHCGAADPAEAAAGAKLYTECGRLLYALSAQEVLHQLGEEGGQLAKHRLYAAAMCGVLDASESDGSTSEWARPCEEVSLQLLMYAAVVDLAAVLVDEETSTAPEDRPSSVSAPGLAMQERCVRALLGSLERQLDRTEEFHRASEQAAELTPVLVVLNHICAFSTQCKVWVKDAIFPTPWALPVAELSNSESAAGTADAIPTQASPPPTSPAGDQPTPRAGASIDPVDAPAGSLRARLLRHMTSLDSQLKRCAAELLYLLCNEDADEFTARTGFGNAVALLQIKGII